ncbi:D-alanyl-D-alanine carboxypeptidase [Lactobacillus pentosus] [Lactiplantibacillus mudanjiangensis]|nr:D-alanyl-D-alanine carboxypeptidase [Lactobacillus pentosus] [Lactiplantibacillus mudanjiangensis]
MMKMQRSLVGLISMAVLLGGVVGASASAKVTYVRVKPELTRLAVYPKVPKTAHQVKLGHKRQLSAYQVYQVVQRRHGSGGEYVQLKGHGWLKQNKTAKLTHVKSNGTLAIIKQQAARGTLTAKTTVKKLTVSVNGPQATQKVMQHKTLTAAKAKAAHLKVTQAAQTDFGQYYYAQGKSGIHGWIKATTVNLSITLPADADTVITTPKPVAVAAAPTVGITAPISVVTPTTPVTTPTKPANQTSSSSQSNQSSVATSTTSSSTTSSKTPVVTKPATAITSGPLTEAQAMAKINALITQNHIMGTLLVTNDGPAGVKVMNYGDANVTKKIPNSTNQPYPLASLEKALTGAVVQHLINEGKLTMTTSLSQYYPQVPFAKDITIRELLDHTSGIRMGEPIPTPPLTNESDQVAFTISHLTSTDQHIWNYSNANFTLLAGIIGKVTGKSYMSNLQSDVLTPLGMQHTFLYNQIPSNLTNPLSYTDNNGQSQPNNISTDLLSSELGCGNVYASVGDYYTFINSLFTGKLDGQAGFQQLSDGQQIKYSGGVYYRAGNTVRIGGADNGFRSYYFGTNNGKVAVVLFANQGNWKGADTVAEQIQDIVSQSEKF